MEGTEANTGEVLGLYQAGDWAGARHRCLQELERVPSAGLLHLLALIDLEQGHFQQALENAQAALRLRPDSAPLLTSSAALYGRLGRHSQAESLVRQALSLDPDWPAAHLSLAQWLQRRGAWGEARQHFQRALAAELPCQPSHPPGHQPADLAARQGWLSCLLNRAVVPLEPAIRLELERCFACAGLDLQGAGRLVFLSLTHESFWPAIQCAARRVDLKTLRSLSSHLWLDGLLNLALRTCLCTDMEVEEVVTCWRRALTLEGVEQYQEFARSLALHFQNHEFVQAVSESEEQRLAQLSHQSDPESLLILAMYRAEPTELAPRSLAIECLTEISDEVSKRVQEQYEEHPYPRWLSLHRHRPMALADVVEQACGTRPQTLGDKSCRILVAGCGTGKAALSLATQILGAQVLAVDLSRSSLAFALQMSEHLQISNIQFGQADILQLGHLSQRFHAIDCSGVLHHMADPGRGWQVLRGLLLPGGLMRVGLYSRQARRGIGAAQALAQSFARSDQASIRRWRQMICELPPEHPARAVLKVEDFYTTSMCRDLAFHVQERLFDLQEVQVMLEQLQLELLGFELADSTAQATFSALFGDAEARQRPALWEAFEKLYPDTFLGMYSFWCRCSRQEC